MKGSGTRPPLVNLVDLVYLVPWGLAAAVFHDVRGPLGYMLLMLFACSWWRDWKSCATVTPYFLGKLFWFDLATAGNYVGLVLALTRRPPEGLPFSAWLPLHWFAVFAIYIAWNLVVFPKSDPPTRRMFLSFSGLEVVPLAACLLLATAKNSDAPFHNGYMMILGFVSVCHGALLVAWELISRRQEGGEIVARARG